MRKKILCFFGLVLVISCSLSQLIVAAIAEDDLLANVLYHSPEGSSQKKILVLVIASDDQQVYIEMQRIWSAYMHLDPEHVEVYFIKGNPDLEVPYAIEGDVIWSKSVENIFPGILNKTLLSMECMLPRLHEFDYVLRTNLSSFYVFPRLQEFLNTLPEEECYCAFTGYHNNIAFGSGAGYILSPDLVEMLLIHMNELMNVNHYDDVTMGAFFQRQGIGIRSAPRLDLLTLEDWEQHKDSLPDHCFHFRIKNPNQNLRLRDDIYILSQLLQMFYHLPGDF